jgi:hypothetical protein
MYRLGGTYPWGSPDPERFERWRREDAPRISGPAPVVLIAATSPRGDQVPRGAGSLIREAQLAGWRVVATYALAEQAAWRRQLVAVAKDGAHWRDISAEMIETLCVRLASPGVRGFAVWVNRRWDCGWLVGPDGFERHGARSIVERVRSTIVDPSLINA